MGFPFLGVNMCNFQRTKTIINTYQQLIDGFNHLEKYEFVNGKDYPISWKIKHVPNHQPDILVFTPTNKTNQPELGFVGAILQLNHFFTQTHFSRAVHPHLLAFDLPLEPFSRGQRHLLRLGPRGPRGDYPLVA